jgi:glycosyltransferase involved in cell wall biosynthesis
VGLTVCVATFGDREWKMLAERRAIPSARPQAPTISVHGATLADARNACLARVTTELVVFLDADDELEPGYADAMLAGTADLRAPQVRYVRARRFRASGFPKVAGHHHDCTADCLVEGNWLVIGTCVRADLLRSVGGFWDEPLYEDWSAWLRC